MALIKMSNFISEMGPQKLSTQREDMILIKGKFYHIDNVNMMGFTEEMLLL